MRRAGVLGLWLLLCAGCASDINLTSGDAATGSDSAVRDGAGASVDLGGVDAASGCASDVGCPGSDGGSAQLCCGGACINPRSDLINCGRCGLTCVERPRAHTACVAGHCVNLCLPGFADCNGVVEDGCEVELTMDPANCGVCAGLCATPPNASAGCTGGTCGIGTCRIGFADCNGSAADGCEADLAGDPASCGGCGNVCPPVAHAASVCAGGLCGVACTPGFADCNVKLDDGCEADLLALATCGACGVVCPVPAHATPACVAGVCGIAACDQLFGDCDGNAANGCGISLDTDRVHCGACGVACAQGEVCRASVCGKPQFSLADTVNYPVGSYPMSIATADLDGDGKLDLVTDDMNSSQLSFLRGVGDGTFEAAKASPLPGRAVGVALGDVDGDGKLDAVVGDADASDIRVALGQGDGTFAAATSYAGGTKSWYQALGDLDGDGWLDIVASDSTGTGDYTVLLNQGNGTFHPATVAPTCLAPLGLALRDLDGDGKLDVAFTCPAPVGLLAVHLGQGNGTFGPMTTYASGIIPWAMTGGDVDGDGDVDLVVANDGDDDVGVYLNPGNALLAPRALYPAGHGGPLGVALADLDGDAWLDVVVANASYGGSIGVLLNHGDATFAPPLTFLADQGTADLALGDFDGDGRIDVAAINFNSNDVSVLLNTSM